MQEYHQHSPLAQVIRHGTLLREMAGLFHKIDWKGGTIDGRGPWHKAYPLAFTGLLSIQGPRSLPKRGQ